MIPSMLIERAGPSNQRLAAYFDLSRDLPGATLFAHGLAKGESVAIELLASPKPIEDAAEGDWLPVPNGAKRCALTFEQPVFVVTATGAYRVVSERSAGPLRVGLFA